MEPAASLDLPTASNPADSLPTPVAHRRAGWGGNRSRRGNGRTSTVLPYVSTSASRRRSYVEYVWKTSSPRRRKTERPGRSPPSGSSSSVTAKSSLNVLPSEESHGKFHPRRRLQDSIIAIGARETAANEVSRAGR